VVGWCDGGEWAACFGLSLHALFMTDFCSPSPRIMRDPDQRYYLRNIAGTMGIASARNEIVTAMLDQTDAEYLFMVDSDMGFEPDIVERLVSSLEGGQYDVMGALAFALKRRLLNPNPLSAELTRLCPTIYDYVELDVETGFTPRLRYERDAVQQCAGTGAAAVLIGRSVLLRIRERYGNRWFEPMTHPTGDRGAPRTFGEDLSFCVRVAAVGGRMAVDTAVKTAHAKGGIFLTEEQYDIQCAVDEGVKYAQAEAERAAQVSVAEEGLADGDVGTGERLVVMHSRQNGKMAALEGVRI